MPDFDVSSAIAGVIIGILIASAIAIATINKVERDNHARWHKSAIEANAGHYECDKYGNRTWVWTGKEKVE